MIEPRPVSLLPSSAPSPPPNPLPGLHRTCNTAPPLRPTSGLPVPALIEPPGSPHAAHVLTGRGDSVGVVAGSGGAATLGYVTGIILRWPCSGGVSAPAGAFRVYAYYLTTAGQHLRTIAFLSQNCRMFVSQNRAKEGVRCTPLGDSARSKD